MFRRFRKRSKPKPDQDKNPSFAATGEDQKQEAPMFQNRELDTAPIIEASRLEAIHILTEACHLLDDTYYDEAQKNQSKGLELAQQMLSENIVELDVISKALYLIKETLTELHFVAGGENIGGQAASANLGESFPDKNQETRLTTILHKAIQAANLPDIDGQPLKNITFQTTAEQWLKFIFSLLKELPDEEPKVVLDHPFQGSTDNNGTDSDSLGDGTGPDNTNRDLNSD